MIKKPIAIVFCLTMIFANCKQDDCIHINKGMSYQLDTANFSMIPYNDFDTIVLRLISTNDTLSFFADKWITDTDPYDKDPCKNYISREYRVLFFTCRESTRESLKGMSLVISHRINNPANREEIVISFRSGYYVFPVSKTGSSYKVDSMMIQGTTYYEVNYIPDQYGTIFPFGCFYNMKHGILKMHFMDKDWPVPQGGEPWELLKR